MTKEEYEEIKANLNSDDPLLKIQARFLVNMFPEWGGGHKYTMREVQDKLRGVLEESDLV